MSTSQQSLFTETAPIPQGPASAIFALPIQPAAPRRMPIDTKLVERFRSWALALEPKIKHASRPMTQNPTPKRNREYQSRMIDARNLERLQKALLALADAHESGSVSPLLSSLRVKDDIFRLVRKYVDRSKGGYYSAIESLDFCVTTPAARLLQEMIDVPSAQRAERDRLRKIAELEAEIKLSNIPGYFPTQREVVTLMLQRARLSDGLSILEPEAGSGHIADAIRAEYPAANVQVIEPVLRLREILTLKGYELIGDDLMQLSAAELGTFDRIVMNPPFEKQQDIDHVRKAYTLLAADGVLVAIMSSSFEFRSDRKSTEFRAWLESVNALGESLPDGAFKASGTGVSTRMVTIEKNEAR